MALTKIDISLMENTTGFTIVTKVVTVAASKLVTDGVSQDTLTLTEGYTYKFDTSHATMSGHTFAFATAADAAGSTQYTTGVTTNGTPGNAGAYTQIIVAQSAPALYYYCANHASMGGTISTPAAVIANKLLAYDGSGNLPVVDGSLLTGIPSPFTTSASDPTVSTNPSGGVGTEWCNTTSGEVYICTDATAGENVWTNVGAEIGNIAVAFGGKGGGTQYGFAAGGNASGNLIDKFSLTSDENASDIGDLPTSRGSAAGHSSYTHGYISAGAAGPFYKSIERYSFEGASNSQSHGDLAGAVRNVPDGQSSLSYGYTSGGTNPYPTPLNVIDKFSFSSNVSGTDHADLRTSRFYQCGHSSSTHGWNSAGNTGSTTVAMIDNFSFAATNTTADVATLVGVKQHPQGHSSSTHGFVAGGHSGSASTSTIDKFAFSNNALTSGIGNLNFARQSSSSQSSNTHGYSGGGAGASTTSNIEKYSFDTGTTTANVGNLTVAQHSLAGAQY